MKTKIFLTLLVFLLVGCVAGANPSIGHVTDAGYVANFWHGLWHGLISPFMFIISLFDEGFGVYEVNNNGWPYTLGFLIGVVILYDLLT